MGEMGRKTKVIIYAISTMLNILHIHMIPFIIQDHLLASKIYTKKFEVR